jgi:hypothetical protein
MLHSSIALKYGPLRDIQHLLFHTHINNVHLFYVDISPVQRPPPNYRSCFSNKDNTTTRIRLGTCIAFPFIANTTPSRRHLSSTGTFQYGISVILIQNLPEMGKPLTPRLSKWAPLQYLQQWNDFC